MSLETVGKEGETTLSRKDFASDQNVRWCPGCGDYVILANMQKAFAKMGDKKENFVSISGIGCSSRITYYLDTYGIHSIHGRAIAVSTGLKLANPKLNVWTFTGDGDCMAIGGNHFIHACRRNIDLNIVIFNNKIYGMTKGQSSPTTPLGTKTKTAPEGTYENTFNIGEVAISSGATFFARVPDNNHALLENVMMEAYRHKGVSVIEVLQNCVIFTDGIHEIITGKDTRDDNQVLLEHGKPILFGGDKTYGIQADGMKLRKTEISDPDNLNGSTLVHDAAEADTAMHVALSRMQLPDHPVASGIIRNVESKSFDSSVHETIENVRKNRTYDTVTDVFKSGNTWDIN
ncbi:MAG TPA: 2-oxoacid:ferredoxin oxidoreductase subunit beta [Balneolaceae bacterium]|nr:2-oxoacid:ferredoxin oxidoreductase subunit beta [Balneolaceae bacterium]